MRHTDGDSTFENLQAYIGPFTNGLEVDTAVNECLGEISPSRAQRICTNCHGPLNLVGFEELDSLFLKLSSRTIHRQA